MNVHRSLWIASLLLLTIPALSQTHPPSYVSSISISGAATGGSDQYATGIITIGNARDVDFVEFLPANGSFYFDCDIFLIYAWGCRAIGGQLQVKLYGPCVTEARAVTITARSLYMNDLGQTADLAIKPATVSLQVPSFLLAGKSYTGHLTSDEKTPLTATFTVAPSVASISNFDRWTGEFTVGAGGVSQVQTATISAQVCGVTASAPVTVIPSNGRPLDLVCDECNHAGAPINLANGNVWIAQQDYSLPGIGGGLALRRTWNSFLANGHGMFGDWNSNLEQRLETLDTNTLMYWDGDGAAWLFTYQNDNWVLISPPDRRATLTFDTSTLLFTLRANDGTVRIFNNSGYLTNSTDRNGNEMTYTYDSQNKLTRVTDAAGRWLAFGYTTYNVMIQIYVVGSVSDASGEIATYGYDTAGRLRRVDYPDTFIRFNHDSEGYITSVVDSEDKVLEAHTYDDWHRGLTSERANGAEKITVAYPSSGVTTVTDSKGNVTEYKFQEIAGKHYMTSSSGPGCATCGRNGNRSFAYDAFGNLMYETDPLGRIKSYTHDAAGNVTSASAGGTESR